MIGTQYKFRHYRQGSLIWASDGPRLGEEFPVGLIHKGSKADIEVRRSQLWTPNALADEGEKDILDVYLDDVAVRASLFLRLYNDTPAETDTLATLTGEVTGTGYGAITLTRGTDWSDPALDSGDMQSVTPTKTFTAGGAWSAATQLVLASVASGTAGLFIAWAALSQSRTLGSGDTMDVTMAMKLA
jgi:hypothetical protein